MKSVSCSWCHTINPTTLARCRECGHQVGIPRMDCRCQTCHPAEPALEALRRQPPGEVPAEPTIEEMAAALLERAAIEQVAVSQIRERHGADAAVWRLEICISHPLSADDVRWQQTYARRLREIDLKLNTVYRQTNANPRLAADALKLARGELSAIAAELEKAAMPRDPDQWHGTHATEVIESSDTAVGTAEIQTAAIPAIPSTAEERWHFCCGYRTAWKYDHCPTCGKKFAKQY